MTKFIYKPSQLTERINYEYAKNNHTAFGKEYHLGQLKLLLSEIFFLSRYVHLQNVIVLYVGAANGYHTYYMAKKLFPMFTFHLYDRTRFHKNFFDKPSLGISNPPDNIKLFMKYFTDEEAHVYKSKYENILFMCDMRNLDIKMFKNNDSDSADSMDKIVGDDMNDQMTWGKIMKPIASYFKFRLPYKESTFEYFDGTIYLQPYAPLGTESRLLVTDYTKMKTYDCAEFDEKCAYFNFFIRAKETKTKWNKIMKKNKLKIIWDTQYALFITEFYLKKMKQPHKKSDTVKCFLDMLEYSQLENKKKFSRLYSK